MIENGKKIERAILAGVHTGSGDLLRDTTRESIAELEQLARTAGLEVVGTLIQNRTSVDSATYLGEGKIEELNCAAAELEADVVIFDDELSPVQIRNISDALELKVIDRTALILDIFAARAITKEGKIQVELAQLRYLLPRLTGMGKALSRLGAGIGTRGPGETKLETDRRHIRRRIEALRNDLEEVQRHRDLLRTHRKKEALPVVALVGYTNAGKSTLLNLLTGADVLAEDKLFATLDPTQRSLTLSDNRSVLLVDTVGFIRKLPTHLIQAFRSTLEEAALADILIHVIDVSNPEYRHHIEVVEDILQQIGASGKPTIAVLNKIDLIEDFQTLPNRVEYADSCVAISARTQRGVNDLMEMIERTVPGRKQHITACIPYTQGRLLAALHETQVVEEETYIEEGTLVRALVDAETYALLRNYLMER